jgi:hypothetical protein
VQLLANRLLSTGGWNYGNTFVLGQELRPHVQPTGLCLLALAGEEIGALTTLNLSFDYLASALGSSTATASLCYGVMGLTAHARRPKYADAWLEAAAKRTLARDPAVYQLALLALAALDADSLPLVQEARHA